MRITCYKIRLTAMPRSVRLKAPSYKLRMPTASLQLRVPFGSPVIPSSIIDLNIVFAFDIPLERDCLAGYRIELRALMRDTILHCM